MGKPQTPTRPQISLRYKQSPAAIHLLTLLPFASPLSLCFLSSASSFLRRERLESPSESMVGQCLIIKVNNSYDYFPVSFPFLSDYVSVTMATWSLYNEVTWSCGEDVSGVYLYWDCCRV